MDDNEEYRIVLETDDPDLYVSALRAMKENAGDMELTINLALRDSVVVMPVEVLVRVSEIHSRYRDGSVEVIRTPEHAATVPT